MAQLSDDCFAFGGPLMSAAEAMKILKTRLHAVTGTETVKLAQARGRVLAAPVVQVSPLMGSSLVIVVFAVVVIGGMGSIVGAIVSGLVLGLIEGLTKVVYPEASNIVVFVIMALVLIWRPAGLFGKEQ